MDQAVRDLATPVLSVHRAEVAAVGGYGRRELCPRSDVDLLVLHDGLEHPALEAIVRAVVYPLWDAGLRVGYAVRDRREAVDAIADTTAATSMLDLRPVAGDASLGQVARTQVLRRLRRRPDPFLRALRSADRERHRRAGDAAEALEPDLKDGAGGLRDVQSLTWAAAALVGTPGLDPLVPAGYLGAPDRPRLVEAVDRLLAARVALHLTVLDQEDGGAGTSRSEVLRLDQHGAVAGRLGYVDRGPTELAPHQLLTDLILAARTVDHVHRRAWSLIGADVERGARRRRRPTQQERDGFELVDGVLRIPEAADLAHPELPGRLLVALADTGAVLDRGSAARLRARLGWGELPWRWTDRERERLLRVLWRGRVSLPAIAELDDVGLLTAVLPEWARLRGRPQRSPLHRYALDRHCWYAAAELGDLVRREAWAAETLREVDDRDGLLLGTLLHDIGKAEGEPHAETGVAPARAVAERLGASSGTIDRVGRLVRLHLLLPETARRRDVTDPALARELAERIGDRETLACLHLLAVADGRATGPAAWTDWTASLVRTLVTKVRAVLDELHPDDVAVDAASPSAGDGAVVTVHDAQRMAPELGTTADAVREHLALLPTRYARAVSARAVVRHTIMCAQPPGPAEVVTRVTPGADAGERLDELDVVAIDHPGWFAKVAGVVALHRGSVVAADAFTREDDLAVDTFKVRPPAGAGGAWWAAVEGDLHEAAAGKLAVRARVAREARADRRRVARLPAVATELSSGLDPSGSATVVEVHTLDRIGVLYAIATAFAELELDIVVARVQTLGHEVVDAFSLRGADGRPLDDDHLRELELAVVAAIDEL